VSKLMGEFSGRLSERVRFEGRDEVRGSAGDRVSGWAVRFERWALVEPLRRSDASADGADTRHSARRWLVTIRDGQRPTLDMRLRWRAGTFRLTGIEADPAAPGWLVIWAEDADSGEGPDAQQS
jgi:head-tail adaptor